MDINEIKKIINNNKSRLDSLYKNLDIDSKKKEIEDLVKITNDSSFWNNDNTKDIINKLNNLRNIVNSIDECNNGLNENCEFLELLISEKDESNIHLLEDDVNKVNNSINELEKYLLLSGPYDNCDIIFEIHSGAGGTEACDWAEMLYRMYLRYFDKNNYKYSLISYIEGEETGIKSVSLSVSGNYPYGYLKSEKGVHRLVRLSPFDSNNKRHTSFASIFVSPIIKDDVSLKIDEKDLKIDVYRSSGAGGQHVNTTDSAVRITHLPTKIVVTCQNERSQIQNRECAMRILKSKLLFLEKEKKEKELNSINGNNVNIEFGNQIRSYVMHPYSMVKDHRTNIETSNVNEVLDGNLDIFIEGYLRG